MIKFRYLITVFILYFVPYILSAQNVFDTIRVEVFHDSTIVVQSLIENSKNILYGDYVNGRHQGGTTKKGEFNDNFNKYVRTSSDSAAIEINVEKNQPISIKIHYSQLPDSHEINKVFYYSDNGNPKENSGLCVVIKKKNLDSDGQKAADSDGQKAVDSGGLEATDSGDQKVANLGGEKAVDSDEPSLGAVLLTFVFDYRFIGLILFILVIILFIRISILGNRVKMLKEQIENQAREPFEAVKNLSDKKEISNTTSISQEDIVLIVNELLSQYMSAVEKQQETFNTLTEVQNDLNVITRSNGEQVITTQEINSQLIEGENLISNEVSYNPVDKSFSIEENEMSIFKIYSRGENYFYTLEEKEEIRKELIGVLASYSGCIESELKSKTPQRVTPIKDGRLRKDGNKFYIISSELLKVELV